MQTAEVGDLDIAFEADGPEDGAPVLLLHGWPDDASTWDAVGAMLRRAGHRTIVPTLRGFGRTRFRRASAPRTANSGMLAIDAIGLLDALAVGRCAVVGHDWGANVAEAMAVGWPDRITRMAMLSTPPRLGGVPAPPFRQAQLDWYHWFMATRRGAEAIRADRRGFALTHWRNWGPEGWFDQSTFDRVALAFDNPDWVDVTLHSYRARWNEAKPDPRSAALERKIKATKTLALPTIYFLAEQDGVNPPEAHRDVPGKFTGPFDTIRMAGVGHFAQREAAGQVAANLVAFLAGA